jgi:adenylate kinase family enzyme
MIAMNRVVVIGTSCSGKTTLARRLAETIGVTHIELDSIYWKPDWCPRPDEEFRALTAEAVLPECWVADGNYSKVRDIVWGKATAVIWLNYPFHTVLWRAFSRTLKRAIRQEELFSGNRETFRRAFLSRDSILWWVLTTFHRRRREFRAIFDGWEFPHLTIIELRKPDEAEELLRLIGSSTRHSPYGEI